MSDATEVRGRRPGRPRSAVADASIVRATLELLLEDGYRALTMEQVRARAGVGKATLYRRYGSKQELVAETLQTGPCTTGRAMLRRRPDEITRPPA